MISFGGNFVPLFFVCKVQLAINKLYPNLVSFKILVDLQNLRNIVLSLLFFLIASNLMTQRLIHLSQLDRKVSFDFVGQHGFMLLQVRLNNMLPLQFIFDTGSENTILFKKTYSDLLGINYDKKIPLLGADLTGPTYAYIARNILLNIDNKMILPSDILVLEENYFNIDQYTGTPIDGIIGANIFRFYVIYVDNKRKEISFIPKSIFKPPNRFQKLPASMKRTKIYLDATTELGMDTTSVKLIMDSGAALPLLLYTNTHPDFELPENTITGNLGIGLGGFLEGYVGRMEELSYGSYNFNQIVTFFQEVNMELQSPHLELRNGILGNTILSRFNYYIDYVDRAVYMKPNKQYKKKFKFDKSGLVIAATGVDLKQFVVQRVLPNSPAEEAGIVSGDLITKMKWVPSKFLSINAFVKILSSKAGRTVNVTINRNGEIMKKKITLRELI